MKNIYIKNYHNYTIECVEKIQELTNEDGEVVILVKRKGKHGVIISKDICSKEEYEMQFKITDLQSKRNALDLEIKELHYSIDTIF